MWNGVLTPSFGAQPTAAKNPQKPEEVKWKEVRPLKLRNTVTMRGTQDSNVVCISEMMNLFQCLEGNEFVEDNCVKETEAFRNCYQSYLNLKRSRRMMADPKEPVPGSKKFTKDQLNTLLQRYPQTYPKDK
ncbi:Coiled-coil-helix-coiled-coil-helix domain-containing protein 1-like protein [Dinothrombium tinctorium]|uniref:Coiled-coil-helix-coiled-coil-helix domain-containing protein 1-like protein n=1 Tax=Dinothrombium tinctorium TaxID=1965070 RepID=A0A3S3NKF5_9ACAR|nr:Coiled-coil-helix-coiled-coil-helix domain-containing protein 1-like protein [Dinothrombium tinctorium]